MASFSLPWPDPNSSVLSKIDFGVPLVELFKWVDVRDTLLGDNFKKQDVTAALALARDCKHPDAEWLTSILKDVSTKEQVGEVFLSHQNDARALCFAGWFTDDREDALLRRAAEMGNAFACSFLCQQLYEDGNEVVEEEFFRLAQFAASLYERDGFRWLGCCFEEGIGCEKDLKLAKENFLIAAELGHIDAALDCGRSLDRSDPARWLWYGRAALRGLSFSFLMLLSKQVEEFFSGSGNATNVFLLVVC